MGDSQATVGAAPGSPAGAGARLLRFLERRRLARALAIGAAAALLALALGAGGVLERAELASHDARARWLAPRGRSGLIEIVDYDEASVRLLSERMNLDRFGLWPRSIHQRMLEYLARGRPRLVVVDILFAESGGNDEDLDFAGQCAGMGNVVLSAVIFPSRHGAAAAERIYRPLPPGPAARLSLGPARPELPDLDGATWPYPELAAAGRALGSIQLETDLDNVTRRISPAVNHRGRLWPTLPTAVAAAFLDAKPEFAPGLMRLAGREFPLDSEGRRLIRWYGPGRARYRAWPAARLFESESAIRAGKRPDVPPEAFRDKIVILASNAAGAYDLRYTPFGSEPGCYLHAAAIESLVRGQTLRRAGGGWTAAAAAALALAVALAFAGKGWRAALRGSAGYALAAGGYAGAGLALYGSGLWVDLAVPEAAAALALGGSLLGGYLIEGRQARHLRKALARFLSPEVLAEVAPTIEDLRPGVGRRRTVTVMFCDIRGFTPLSEKLPPEAVVELLDAYLQSMSEAIMARGGTLSKYIGDGIMAFWNAPVERPDHAALAARAALDMVAAQEGLKRRLAAAGRPVFDVGIGLHAGVAVVGTVGSEKRLDYTAIGDVVNLASRVEGLTRDFGARIVVTSELAALAGAGFEYRPLGTVTVKGRSAPVEVLELTGEGST